MEIREYTAYNEAEILSLYESVGWINYTRDPEMPKNAFKGSLLVLAAYENDALVGIIRLVGDGFSIIYVQDLLVRPEHQHKGIGSALISEALGRYPYVYQTVLMTDDSEKTSAFYKKQGFFASDDIKVRAFMKMRTKD